MHDDLVLFHKALKGIVKKSGLGYKENYVFHFKKNVKVDFYIPSKSLAIIVEDYQSKDPKMFQLAIKDQEKAHYCEPHHIKLITYDGNDTFMIKLNLLKGED